MSPRTENLLEGNEGVNETSARVAQIRVAINELEIRISQRGASDTSLLDEHEVLVAQLRMAEGDLDPQMSPMNEIADHGNNLGNQNTETQLGLAPVLDVRNETPLTISVTLETIKLDLLGRKSQTIKSLNLMISVLEREGVTDMELEKIHPMLFGMGAPERKILLFKLKEERNRLMQAKEREREELKRREAEMRAEFERLRDEKLRQLMPNDPQFLDDPLAA